MSIDALALIYDLLVRIAGRCAPSGKSRRRLARKLKCAPSMVPDALVCYAAIYGLVGVIVLLSLQALAMVLAS
jgi:hypothetical protein